MREIVVISGKGGTGKTSLTAALAAFLKKTVIADCDVDAADLFLLLQPKIKRKADFYSGIRASIDPAVCTRCGKCEDVCEFNAITGNFQIDKTACEGCGVCYHFCPKEAICLTDRLCGEWYVSDTRFGPMAHARLGIAEENSGKLVTQLKNQAKDIAKTQKIDTILVDSAPGIGCPVISSISGAQYVVAVTEPSLSGLHDLKRVLDLSEYFKIPSAVVINKYNLNPEITKTIQEESEKRTTPVLGRIPYNNIVTEAMIQGKTVMEMEENTVSSEIGNIGNKLLDMI